MSHVQADKLLQQINTKGDQNVANIEPKKKKKRIFSPQQILKTSCNTEVLSKSV